MRLTCGWLSVQVARCSYKMWRVSWEVNRWVRYVGIKVMLANIRIVHSVDMPSLRLAGCLRLFGG
jgi:hypothetical protein